MDDNTPITNFQKLQLALEQVVDKIGIQKTIVLLESFDTNSSVNDAEQVKVKLITSNTVTQSILHFDLIEKEFHTSTIKEYREARMVCYHIIHTYTDCSYAKIGELFGLKKRNILYYCHKCKELLESLQGHKDFVDRYKAIEAHTIKFIGEIN